MSRKCFRVFGLTALTGCLFIANLGADGPWHVSKEGADDAGRDGLSWEEAWATIGYAVGRAATGTILVSNGVYVLDGQIYVDKGLKIKGVNGRDHVIVDGNNANRCFLLNHKNALLEGLTITNGNVRGPWNEAFGGGVRIMRGRLDNCLVVNNRADHKGGGVYVGYSNEGGDGRDASISNCVIRGNSSLNGGGVSLWAGGSWGHSPSSGCFRKYGNSLAKPALPLPSWNSVFPGGGVALSTLRRLVGTLALQCFMAEEKNL